LDERSERRGVLLTLAYDGTDFHGYQRQAGLRTVQQVVEEALARVDPWASTLRACSRTDAGVHAVDQKVAFTGTRAMPAFAYWKELERHLPRDVAVVAAADCDPSYDPRFDAREKTYHYRVRVGRARDPLRDRTHFHLHRGMVRRGVPLDCSDVSACLDVEAMREAASHFVGTHDFNAFRAAGDARRTTVRTIHELSIEREEGTNDCLRLVVRGNSFMKHMVRILAGTLLDVGREHHDASWVKTLVEPGVDRRAGGPTAPPQGLVLVSVVLGRQKGAP
jgi:tRNA pseudouridine38-40 synthase